MKPITILIVEDNAMNRDMLSRRLSRRGFDVTMAEDGRQALDHVDANPPDLVLMDMSLPVMDGYQATSALKANEATARIPVIALTANAMSGDRERCLAAGCDDYATKPTDLDDLIAKIGVLVGRDLS